MSLESKIFIKFAEKRGLDEDPITLAQASRIIKNSNGKPTKALNELNAIGKVDKVSRERNFDPLKIESSKMQGSSLLKFDQNIRRFELNQAIENEDYLTKSLHNSFYAWSKNLWKNVDPAKRDEAIISGLGVDNIDEAYYIYTESEWENIENLLNMYLEDNANTESLTDYDGNKDELNYPAETIIGNAKLKSSRKKIGIAKRKLTWRKKRLAKEKGSYNAGKK